jgi:hypothetical protein
MRGFGLDRLSDRRGIRYASFVLDLVSTIPEASHSPSLKAGRLHRFAGDRRRVRIGRRFRGTQPEERLRAKEPPLHRSGRRRGRAQPALGVPARDDTVSRRPRRDGPSLREGAKSGGIGAALDDILHDRCLSSLRAARRHLRMAFGYGFDAGGDPSEWRDSRPEPSRRIHAYRGPAASTGDSTGFRDFRASREAGGEALVEPPRRR